MMHFEHQIRADLRYFFTLLVHMTAIQQHRAFDWSRMIQFDIRTHIIYWLLIVIFWPLISFLADGEFWDPLINKLGYLPSQMMVSYAFIYYLLPRLFRKQLFSFFMGLIAVTYIATVLARFMKIYFYETIVHYDSNKESILEILTQQDPLLVQYMIWVLMVPALTIIIVLTYSHFTQKKLLAQLESEKAQTELNFLKAQLHPHFLFNTLNNLYALAVQGSEQTKTVAQGLKKLLSHIFERSGGSVIPLSQELELLDTYVSLEKLRYGDRLSYEQQLSLPDEDLYIVPMVLLSIVENAFKHGVSGDLGSPYIRVELTYDHSDVKFTIENSFAGEEVVDRDNYTKGIGIKNVQRQLKLIYGDQFSYVIKRTKQDYKVILTVNRAEMLIQDGLPLTIPTTS